MHSTKKIVNTTIAVLGLLAITVALPAGAEGERVLSGTVEISSIQMAFIISGKAGGGVLEYQGEEYEFSIGGLGVGGIGVAKFNAVGAVYNLNKLEDFSGTYVQVRAGLTVGVGKAALSLGNGKGVELDLKASTSGAALSLGADGMIISLK